MARSVKMIYFSWVRERIGKAEEVLDLPENLATIGDMLDWMTSLGEGYAYALEAPDVIRVALDQQHHANDQPLGDAREIAIFPPMTGG